MSESGLLRIGEFSRATWLSIKALRAYHESGLLVPAEVDPSSGYRSYSAAQLTDAAIIRRLRQLDMPLESIRQVLDARDPGVTKKVLAEHGAAMERRLADMQRSIDDLYAAVAQPILHTPVLRRMEPARTILAVDGVSSEAEFEAVVARVYQSIVDAARASGAVIEGPFGGCYPPLLDDDRQEFTLFAPIRNPQLLPRRCVDEGVRVGELPAVELAVLAHRGDQSTLADSYRSLGAWVAAHAEPADQPVRELYLVTADDTDDVDQHCTEICWPLRPAEH